MAVTITVNGVTATRVRFAGSSIREVKGPAPNTGTLIFNASAPAGGEQIVITNGATTLFHGQAQKVSLSYDGKPANKRWDVTLVDETFQANQRRPFGTWVNVSATTIANAILAAYAPDVSNAGIAASLPAISINFDGSEPFTAALDRIATMINGRSRLDYSNVAHLSLADDGTAPDNVDTSHPPLDNPPIVFSTDLSQVRTRMYGKGYGLSLSNDVLAAETILPIPDVTMFETGGGSVIAGTTAGAAQTQIMSYSGVQGGGGGTLVGPGAQPATAPVATVVAGTGIELGAHNYAYVYVTAAGKSLPSPLKSVTVADITTTVAARPAPTSAPTGVPSGSGGSTSPGNFTARTAFVYSDGVESLPSVDSAVYVEDGSHTGVAYSSIATGPAQVSSRIIRARNTLAAAWGTGDFRMGTVAGNVSTSATIAYGGGDGTHIQTTAAGYAIGASFVFLNNVTGLAASGTVVIGSNTITYTGLTVVSGTLGVITGCSGITATIAIGDTATVTARKVSLTSVTVGPATVTSREIYRTVASGSQLKLLTTLADNTTTTYTDSTADASLGANAPTGDTSGLTQPSGQVNAGSTSLLMASAGAFPTSGWVSLPGSQVVRYTGITTNTLTGIPASGAGSILTTVLYGSQALPSAALIGINGGSGTPVALARGSTVAIWVQRNDTAAQAALSTLEKRYNGTATDGIREDTLFDGRLGLAALTAACDARLAEFSTPIVSVTYATRDSKTRAGATVHIDLSTFGLAGDYTIQDVTISFDGRADAPTVFYQVKAASVAFTLSDLLRLVQLTSP